MVVLLGRGASSGAANARSELVPGAGQPVDGIKCQSHEQALFHIHAHLAILVGDQARQVPAGIGIPDAQVQTTTQGPFVLSGSCFYWLHSHTEDGVIHVESREQRVFRLGNYFDIWGQSLTNSAVGGDRGQVIVYVNGQRFVGDPRAIPLDAHAVIQLDVGTDTPPSPFTFPAGL